MNLTILGKPMFYRPGVRGGVYPCRVSSRARGSEIADYLGAEYIEDFAPTHERRIFLKPRSLKRVRDGDYIDVMDNHRYIEPLKKRPGIKLISMSQAHHDFLTSELDNEVHLIYHHHINFENATRVKNETLVGGMIGKGVNHTYKIFEEIKNRLSKVGIGFDAGGLEYKTRQDMLDFFNRIDFLVIRYPKGRFTNSPYIHPGKIVNSASFGIPTISQYLKGYQEFDGDYLIAETYNEIVEQAVRLQNDAYYKEMSEGLIDRAKDFHISKTTEEYKKLWT